MEAEPMGYAFAHALCQKADDRMANLLNHLGNAIVMPKEFAEDVAEDLVIIRDLLNRVEFHAKKVGT